MKKLWIVGALLLCIAGSVRAKELQNQSELENLTAQEGYDVLAAYNYPSDALVNTVAEKIAQGNTLINGTGSADKRIKKVVAEKNGLMHSLQQRQELVNVRDFTVGNVVTSLAMTLDGKKVVAGSSDGLYIWNAETGKLTFTSKDKRDTIAAVAITFDGKTVVAGSFVVITAAGKRAPLDSALSSSDSVYSTLRLWDAETGKLIKELTGHKGFFTSIAISADGKTVVSGSWDATVCIWDTQTGELIHELKGHAKSITSVAISANGKTVVSGSADKTVRIWSAETGELKQELANILPVQSVSITPDGKKVVSGAETVRVWDTQTGELIKEFPRKGHFVASVAITADGKTVVSSSYYGPANDAVYIWNTETADLKKELTGIGTAFAITGNGKTVAAVSAYDAISISSTETGEQKRTLKMNTGNIRAIAFKADGNIALAGSHDATLLIWDLEHARLKKEFTGNTSLINSVAITPDEKKVVSASGSTLSILDGETGKLKHELKDHTSSVMSVAITPDGKTALFGSADGVVRILNAETGKLIQEFTAHKGLVGAVAITPDGKRVVSGSSNGTVRLWNAKNGKLMKEFTGSTSSVTSVAIASDGKTVASGLADGTVCVWSAEASTLELKLREHTGPVTAIAIGLHGNKTGLVFGSERNLFGGLIEFVNAKELIKKLTLQQIQMLGWKLQGKVLPKETQGKADMLYNEIKKNYPILDL